jgi:hypothetical protein
MNPYDDWLQRLLGQQQAAPPQQLGTTIQQQPFSAPTQEPEPQNPFVAGLRNVMGKVGSVVAATPQMRVGGGLADIFRQGGQDQSSAWNALMGSQPSAPSQNVQSMTPEQQFQIFSDVGGLVNPIAGTLGRDFPSARTFAETLFSRLQRAIGEAPVSPKGASAKEWMGILTPKTAKGEREFTGVEDFLKSDPARVITKNELDELARKKGVRFSEVQDDRYENFIQPGRSENYRMIMLVKEPTEEVMDALKPFEDAYSRALEAQAKAKDELQRGIKMFDFLDDPLQYNTERTKLEDAFQQAKIELDVADTAYRQKQEELMGIPYRSHNNVPENTLAHLRLSDRIDPITGEKKLFVEELQSDMLQELRDYGPIQGTKAEHDAEVDRLMNIALDIRYGGPDEFDPVSVERAFSRAKGTPDLPQPLSAKRITKKPDETFNELRKWMENPENTADWEGYTSEQIQQTIDYLKAAAEAEMFRKRVPGGQPFTKGEEWTELLLKRVLKEAVDGGYNTVVLPRGAQVQKVVGGPRSAMAQYYETNVPNILKDYGKKLGVKIEINEAPTKNILTLSANQFSEQVAVDKKMFDTEFNTQFDDPESNPFYRQMLGNASTYLAQVSRIDAGLTPQRRTTLVNYREGLAQEMKNYYDSVKSFVGDKSPSRIAQLDEAYNKILAILPKEPTNLEFRITPDLKSAVSKEQRLWGTSAAALPGVMELLRQRNGIPPKKDKEKKK